MKILLLAFPAIVLVPLALALLAHKKKKGPAKKLVIINLVLFFAFAAGLIAFMPSLAAAEAAEEAVKNTDGLMKGLGYLGAALSTGMSCVGAGIAVSGAASAAIGATSENPKMFAKSMLFVALAEGVALYGMLISFQIIGAIG